MRSLLHALGASTLLLAACGGAASSATPTPSSTSAATPTQTVVPASSAPTSATGDWTVTAASKATVSVREQLVGVSLPSDAVLTAGGASGAFTLKADGTFAPDSKITFDLSTLTSDQRDRDGYVKRSTLEVSRYPTATFVPTKTSGLALPLAASGELTFTLAGTMTIHGVSKPVTFAVTATRSGAQLTATATADPIWHFADFGMNVPSVPFRVVSVTDEIHLVVTLVATGPAA